MFLKAYEMIYRKGKQRNKTYLNLLTVQPCLRRILEEILMNKQKKYKCLNVSQSPSVSLKCNIRKYLKIHAGMMN